MSILNDDSINVEVSPAKAYEMFVHVLKCGLVPLLHGAPMTSKSSIARKAAKELNLKFIDCRLSTKDTVDLTGMIQVTPLEFDKNNNPLNQQAYYVPFDTFPIEGDPVPKGKAGWLLFFDELLGINKSMEIASYQIILDRAVGSLPLHDKCFVAGAGNDPKHGAISSTQGTAAKTRVVHIYVKQDMNSWINDFAYGHHIDPRIIGFVRQHPDYLTNFAPNTGAITYCGSRTLAMLSELIQGMPVNHNALPLIAGTIGLPAAQDFITFVTVYSQLEDFATLMANPAASRTHLNPIHQFILVDILVAGMTTQAEMVKAIQIVRAFGPEYPVLLVRGALERNQIPNMKAIQEVRDLTLQYSQYFRS